MSVKIKVSYKSDQELQEVLELLRPVIKKVRPAERKGEFNRAYIELK